MATSELELPDLSERDVITLEDAMAGFAARRSKRPAQPTARKRTPPKVDVYPGPDGDGWQIGCDEVLVKWDVETGQEAEEMIRELLARQAPELLKELEFDSYPEAFFATAASEATARAVAALIQARD